MKTITIEIPEGKRAEWVDGVLTLVDEQPVEFKMDAPTAMFPTPTLASCESSAFTDRI